MKILTLITCLIFSSCASVIDISSTEQVGSSYTGSIIFGTPSHQKDKIKVPISFAGGEWNRNSAVCFRKAKVTIKDRVIALKIYTALCSSYSSSAEFYIDDSCYGLYQVILENPGGTSHIIGKLNIPNMQNKSQQTNR